MASAVTYMAEHEAQPEKFRSIPAAMWWGVVTLTTLGYGDVYPVAGLGRMMAGIFALSGVLMVALPTAIRDAGFMEVAEEASDERAQDSGLEGEESRVTRTSPGHCPHCGGEL